uniref:Uncharacterized protein n=1 Tax=Cacopsylla melanoneura TaxID=428564 RepID=A0A8D8R2K8_9HEMI
MKCWNSTQAISNLFVIDEPRLGSKSSASTTAQTCSTVLTYFFLLCLFSSLEFISSNVYTSSISCKWSVDNNSVLASSPSNSSYNTSVSHLATCVAFLLQEPIMITPYRY